MLSRIEIRYVLWHFSRDHVLKLVESVKANEGADAEQDFRDLLNLERTKENKDKIYSVAEISLIPSDRINQFSRGEA